MQFNRILWPTDFSGSAEKALPTVRSLTEKYGTEIHVLYVIEDIAHHKPWYGDFEKERIEKILKWEEKTWLIFMIIFYLAVEITPMKSFPGYMRYVIPVV